MFEKVASFARNAVAAAVNRNEVGGLRKHYWDVFAKINDERGFRGTVGEEANKRYWDVFNRLGPQRQHLVFRTPRREPSQSRQAAEYYSMYYL